MINTVACGPRDSQSGSAFERDILSELAHEGVSNPHHWPATQSANAAAIDLPASGPIALHDLLRVAETRNPAVAAARSEIGIAAGHAWQAARYPNPRIEVSTEEAPFDSGLDQGVTVASITQPIVIGERLRAGENSAVAAQAASRARAELQLREIFGRIAQLHAQIIANQRADVAYGELSMLGAETLRIAQMRFDARAAPETEVIRPQIELYQIELIRARLATERSAAVEQLSLLLGGVQLDASRLAQPQVDQLSPLPIEDLKSTVLHNHPALVLADREIDQAQANLNRIKAERVPDIDVRFGAGYKGETDEGIFELGAGMAIPLWDARQGDILAARFELMRARQRRAVAENELLTTLGLAQAEYETARTQLDGVRDQIVPAAQRSYELTMESYRGGHSSFLELLDAQRTLTEARATMFELNGAFGVAEARIHQIVGFPANSSRETQSQTLPLQSQ